MAMQRFWLEASGCVEEVTTLCVRPTVEVRLLGLVDALALKKVTHTLDMVLLCYEVDCSSMEGTD